MAWTTPRTWADGYVVTGADLNEQVRDNLTALKSDTTDAASAAANAKLGVIPVSGMTAGGSAPAANFTVRADGSIGITSLGGAGSSGNYTLSLASGAFGDYRTIRMTALDFVGTNGGAAPNCAIYIYPSIGGVPVTSNGWLMRYGQWLNTPTGTYVANASQAANDGLEMNPATTGGDGYYWATDVWIETYGTDQVITCTELPQPYYFDTSPSVVNPLRGRSTVRKSTATGVTVRIEYNNFTVSGGSLKFVGVKA